MIQWLSNCSEVIWGIFVTLPYFCLIFFLLITFSQKYIRKLMTNLSFFCFCSLVMQSPLKWLKERRRGMLRGQFVQFASSLFLQSQQYFCFTRQSWRTRYGFNMIFQCESLQFYTSTPTWDSRLCSHNAMHHGLPSLFTCFMVVDVGLLGAMLNLQGIRTFNDWVNGIRENDWQILTLTLFIVQHGIEFWHSWTQTKCPFYRTIASICCFVQSNNIPWLISLFEELDDCACTFLPSWVGENILLVLFHEKRPL